MTGVLALKQTLAQEHELGWTSSYSWGLRWKSIRSWRISSRRLLEFASKARTPSGNWEECAIAYWKYRCYFGRVSYCNSWRISYKSQPSTVYGLQTLIRICLAGSGQACDGETSSPHAVVGCVMQL